MGSLVDAHRRVSNDLNRFFEFLMDVGLDPIVQYEYDLDTHGDNLFLYVRTLGRNDSWLSIKAHLLEYAESAGIPYDEDIDYMNIGGYFFFNSYGRAAILIDLDRYLAGGNLEVEVPREKVLALIGSLV